MEKIKKLLANKKYLTVGVLGLIILALLVLAIMYIFNLNYKINDLEKIKIEEISDEVMNYMEYVEDTDSKEIDKYIIYVLKRLQAEENISEVKLNIVKNNINNIFKLDITKEDIITLGVTPEMMEENIIFDASNDTFVINDMNYSYADIAATKIIKYELKEINKKKKNQYEIIYDKYEVTNPYEILNYYIDNNKETKEINDYLKGNANIVDVKKYITKENISKVGKITKEIKVIYQLYDDNLLIKEVINK